MILFREFAVTGLRAAVAADGVVLAAGKSGKLKTVVQLVGLIYLHFEMRLSHLCRHHRRYLHRSDAAADHSVGSGIFL